MRSLDFARQLRTTQTDSESLLWLHLRAHRLSGLKFRRQQPIGVYIVDFLCADKKLIVELDGGQHQERIEYDAARDAWLKSEGYVVLRYWNNEVMGNLEEVLEDIGRMAGVFAEASPSPQPLSPQGRGASTAIHGEEKNTGNEPISPLPLEGGGAGGEGGATP
ncbi:endonuclease domain-containing protein [Thiobacillus sp.]|uniref:endonuclease domain-containing protein n=1 Tax=Thiobacillus sp. TaxID=924 RepID=UPI0025D92848|nr:endonuclease domain-containing protein [Thiobacillus sp.]MBT9540433.1 endonuclease domain-containing protein [Thiobacillus sp.]